ncbi:MAG: ABC transporter permease [Microcella pacifica]|uniref:ABC transporter permease n=1 Tax=Microcella pacifica TaxID=2591847 RepID=UPI0033156A27
MTSPAIIKDPDPRARPSWGFDWRENIVYIGFVFVLVVFGFTLFDQGFLNPNNLLNILRQTSIIAVMAVGMTFVISAAEIDLSVGAVAGLASVTTAYTVAQWGLFPGILVGLLTGLVVGALNATFVTVLGIPSFLATLGMLGVATGAAQWFSANQPLPIRDDVYLAMFGSGNLGFLPVLAIWMIVFGLIGHVVLRKTPFGRYVLATGGNSVAARFSGLNPRRIKASVLILCSVVAAFAGMLYAGRLESGRYQWGTGDELSVIAAVVLGGTSLFGGKGSVVGAVFGALLIGVVNNGIVLMGLDFSQQTIVRGAIIILAVALARRTPVK